MEPHLAKAAARFAAAVLLVLAARAAPAQAPDAGAAAPRAPVAEGESWVRALENASASTDPDVAHSARTALAQWRARPAERADSPRDFASDAPRARGPRGDAPPRCGPGCCLHGRGARPGPERRDGVGDERRGPPPPRGPRPDGPRPFPGERGPGADGPPFPPPPGFPRERERERARDPHSRPLPPPRTQET